MDVFSLYFYSEKNFTGKKKNSADLNKISKKKKNKENFFSFFVRET
jgi:hypothetical protein